MVARMRVFLLPLLLLLPVGQGALLLQATPDHAPWAEGDVPRLAVKPGNCMTWILSVTGDNQPVAGVAISVTDGDGRRSIHYTNGQGQVVVGTRTCWATDHLADHAFQVTGYISGESATSNRVLHEVMWSSGQVYADVPESGTGATPIPVNVVWTATNEPMPVGEVRSSYGSTNPSAELVNGSGTLHVNLDGQSELVVAVPASAWLAGGADVAIPIRSAGPFYIPPPPSAGGGGSDPPPSSSSSTTSSTSSTASSSTTASNGDEDAPPGAGTPPPVQEPPRQVLPPQATPEDHEAGTPPGDGNSDEGATPSRSGTSKGLPGPGGSLVGSLVLFAVLWRRRQ